MIKKLLPIILIFLTINSIAFAKVGDIVGSIYSTDIKAYVNDIPVKA